MCIGLDHFYGCVDGVCRRVAGAVAFGHTSLFPEEYRSIGLGTCSRCPFEGFPASPCISAEVVFLASALIGGITWENAHKN
jgi:hypothetical protein